MIARLTRIDPRILGGFVFGVALLGGLELVRPFVAGPVGFDSAASVIHFDRIVSGRHLEAFVTATPKPFLTAVYGLLHVLTGDWRVVSLSAIAAYAAAVALGGWFAWRVAGPPAACFCVIGVVGTEALLADVGIAYALPWALLGWLVAGLALTRAVPRPGLAGTVLALASLARLETLVLVGASLTALALATIVARLRGRPAPPRRLWLIGLGLLALPVMLLHDWLLTGDPLFWVSVSTRYSQAAPESVLTPVGLLRFAAARYSGMAILAGLAALGGIVLFLRRAWIPLVAVLGLGPGVGAFLMLLAVRGTYVSGRYFGAIDLALVMSAAVGAAALAEAGSRRAREAWTRRGATGAPRWVAAIAPALAVVLAALASWPIPSLDAHFRSSVRAQRFLAEHSDRAVVALQCAVAPFRDGDDGLPREVLVLVPTLSRPRFAVDLDLGVDQVGGTPVAWLDAGGDFLPRGRFVVHDRIGDRDAELFSILEVTSPTTIAGVTLSPILADPGAGLWVLRIDRGGSASSAAC